MKYNSPSNCAWCVGTEGPAIAKKRNKSKRKIGKINEIPKIKCNCKQQVKGKVYEKEKNNVRYKGRNICNLRKITQTMVNEIIMAKWIYTIFRQQLEQTSILMGLLYKLYQ